MAKNKVLFSNLGKSPKDKIINIVILLVIAVALFFFIRWIVRKVKTMNTEANKELNNALDSGVKLSFSNSQYENFANQLYNAMNGPGTDENAIYNVFNQMKNIADVLKLVTTFGFRKNQDLSTWLYKDLSSNEMYKVNSILSTKGIDYKF